MSARVPLNPAVIPSQCLRMHVHEGLGIHGTRKCNVRETIMQGQLDCNTLPKFLEARGFSELIHLLL